MNDASIVELELEMAIDVGGDDDLVVVDAGHRVCSGEEERGHSDQNGVT